MISRDLEKPLKEALRQRPVVVLLGPRQVGKTTLALKIATQQPGKESAYMDLELDSDLSKLNATEDYLRRFENKLLVIDEIQHKPELFRVLRGLVDIRKRKGEKTGQFLLLGSASRDLLQGTSETLAGRVRYLALTPLTALEIYKRDKLGFSPEKLWFRGGFPDSYLAESDTESRIWRSDFISSYVERDIPLMGPQVAAARMKRFWLMIAHYHGQQVNFSSIAKSLEVSHTTVRSYLDILTDFYMIRQLAPWSGNSRKRIVKSPKIYLRDTGLLHQLLNIADFEDLLAHPVVGASWEGFVIENVITYLPDTWRYSYYRNARQAEIDLILEGPRKQIWAVEIKKSAAPVLSKGFYTACEDIQATHKFVVYAGNENFPMSQQTEAMGLIAFLKIIEQEK